MERKKGKPCLGSVGEGEETIYLGPWGYICFPEKIPESNQVTSSGKVPAQGQVEEGLGSSQPLSPGGGEEEGQKTSSVIYFCVQGPLTLHSWGHTCQTEQAPPLHVSFKTHNYLDLGSSCLQETHFLLFLAASSSLQGKPLALQDITILP